MSNKLLMISPPSNSNSKPSMRSSGTSMEASQLCVTLGSEPKQRSWCRPLQLGIPRGMDSFWNLIPVWININDFQSIHSRALEWGQRIPLTLWAKDWTSRRQPCNAWDSVSRAVSQVWCRPLTSTRPTTTDGMRFCGTVDFTSTSALLKWPTAVPRRLSLAFWNTPKSVWDAPMSSSALTSASPTALLRWPSVTFCFLVSVSV